MKTVLAVVGLAMMMGCGTSSSSSAAPAPTPTLVPAPAPAPTRPDELLAAHTSSPPSLDGVLDDPAWASAPIIAITTDYTGATVSAPETLVRIAWTDDAIYVAFDASFDPPLTAPDAAADTEYEHLYGYDVVEVFLDADPSTESTYREIELGPRGQFLDVAVDLDARPHGDVTWSSGVTHAQRVDDATHRFTIEARIPASAFDLARLSPSELRIGLFRITGHSPTPRLFLARFPTHTPRPNFHVPERFGTLVLAP